jgi:hypothetical protein
MYFNFACQYDDYKNDHVYMSREMRPLLSFLFYKFQLSNADQIQFDLSFHFDALQL